MGEDADLKELSAKVEKGGIDVKDALDELRNRKKGTALNFVVAVFTECPKRYDRTRKSCL